MKQEIEKYVLCHRVTSATTANEVHVTSGGSPNREPWPVLALEGRSRVLVGRHAPSVVGPSAVPRERGRPLLT